jgi:hypothetical protein
MLYIPNLRFIKQEGLNIPHEGDQSIFYNPADY